MKIPPKPESKQTPTKAVKSPEKPEEQKEKAKTVDFILPEKDAPSKTSKSAPTKDTVSKITSAFSKPAEEPAKSAPAKVPEKKVPGKLSEDRAKMFSKVEPEEPPVRFNIKHY